MDLDLENMDRAQLKELIRSMRADIRYVVTQKGDDLCWRDAYLKLAGYLPERPAVDHTPPTPIFLGNCTHFEQSMRDGTKYQAHDCPLRQQGCPGLQPGKEST